MLTAEIEIYHTSDEEEANYMCTVETKGAPKFLSDIFIKGIQVTFKVDTGTGVTILNRIAWQDIRSLHLTQTKLKFKSYNGHKLLLLGNFATIVNYNGKLFNSMSVYAVDSSRISFLGKTWVEKMQVDINLCLRKNSRANQVTVNTNNVNNEVKLLAEQYAQLFKELKGCIMKE